MGLKIGRPWKLCLVVSIGLVVAKMIKRRMDISARRIGSSKKDKIIGWASAQRSVSCSKPPIKTGCKTLLSSGGK